MDLNDNELTLTPINGKSGKAYMGSYPDGERVFVKMNTTPILAGLAKEQIAPQLLWSRRLPDGNVMTAQEWLSGEILGPDGLERKQIFDILIRLHRSRPLMTQLTKLGYALEHPNDLLDNWVEKVPMALKSNQYLQSIIADLRKNLPAFREDYATIVHGDVLSHYIPEARWEEWLIYYGYKYNEKVLEKLYWYSQYSYLCQVAKYYENNDLENVNREIYALRNFRAKYRKES